MTDMTWSVLLMFDYSRVKCQAADRTGLTGLFSFSAFRYSILKQQMCMIVKTCPKSYTAYMRSGKNQKIPEMWLFYFTVFKNFWLLGKFITSCWSILFAQWQNFKLLFSSPVCFFVCVCVFFLTFNKITLD